MVFLVALLLIVLAALIALPIIALVRTGRIRTLELRVAGLEAALRQVIQERASAAAATPAAPPPIAPPPPPPPLETAAAGESIEQIIGRRWLGWVAILLIFGATVYFLKLAFENRWIGELGRVMIGVAGSLTLVGIGNERYRKQWRYLSQVLTGGGIAILYLSVYGAFGYYHLISQRGAFVFLAILVAEAFLMAVWYDAPSIAVTALAGGFLVPILLSTGRDQYATLFLYIALLDLGMLGVVAVRSWRWIGSLAYVGTQVLFWTWYTEHYHTEKRVAALAFQTAVFLLFLTADMAPNLRRRAAGWEGWVRLVVSAFVYYATCYGLLNDDYHDWMAVLALLLALGYAGLARAGLALRPPDRRRLLVTLGTALAFVTIAIPVQMESNWIAIGWAAEGVALLWAGMETGARPMRWISSIVFGLTVGRLLFWDTPWDSRTAFTPVLNRYFLGMLAVTAALAAASYLYGRGRPRAALTAGLAAFAVLWLGTSFEAYTYFSVQQQAIRNPMLAEETMSHWNWAAQLALSLLWSTYGGLFTAAGFRRQSRVLRTMGLVLFGLTLAKVMLLDVWNLRQFYRIVALLALGLVLLGAAWIYQRGLRREQTR